MRLETKFSFSELIIFRHNYFINYELLKLSLEIEKATYDTLKNAFFMLVS